VRAVTEEIAQAFLVATQTIDRRLHRGRSRLRELGQLPDVDDLPDIEARRGSVLHALYLLFNEGYHGSNPKDPVRPFLCSEALRLAERRTSPPVVGGILSNDVARRRVRARRPRRVTGLCA